MVETLINNRVENRQIPKDYMAESESFPKQGMALLKSMSLLSLNVPIEFGGQGIGSSSDHLELLKVLKKIGAYDLSLGRIYEGHVNALSLIANFGTPAQQRIFFSEVLEGRIFGIWNSEFPSEALHLKSTGDGYFLEGAKVFCSGASYIDRPIVTAKSEKGVQMMVLNLEKNELEEDFRYWRPMGMKASVSCRFDFSGKRVEQEQFLGRPYDYVQEPDFTGGAARFAAVQLGGASAAIRATVRHLNRLGRSESVEQAARLGRLAILQETGNLWMEGAAKEMDGKDENPDGYMHYANMFRTITRDICEEVLRLCEMSVGLQGMMKPHPLELIHRDLNTYLKQPGPDRSLNLVGTTFAKAEKEPE